MATLISYFLFPTGKSAVDRMTADMSTELKKREKSVSVISLWPGIVRTEHMQNMAEKAGDRFPFDLENLCKSFTRSHFSYPAEKHA